MARGIKEVSSFIVEYAKIRIVYPLAELICSYIKDGSPQEFEQAINDGWSLVGQIKAQSTEELMERIGSILKRYPDVKAGVDFLKKQPHSKIKAEGGDFISTLNIPKLIDEISKKLPGHGIVLSRHEDWIKKELGKINELLS